MSKGGKKNNTSTSYWTDVFDKINNLINKTSNFENYDKAIVYVDTTKEKLSNKLFGFAVTVFIALISAYIGAYLQTQGAEHQLQDQQVITNHVAQALYYDISVLQDSLNSTMSATATDYITLRGSNSSLIPIVIKSDPYYTDNGLYYAFVKDIANFNNTTLVADTYAFYVNVSIIEKDRAALYQFYLEYGENDTSLTNSSLNPKILPGDSNEIIGYANDLYYRLPSTDSDAGNVKQALKMTYNLPDSNYGYPTPVFFVWHLNPKL